MESRNNHREHPRYDYYPSESGISKTMNLIQHKSDQDEPAYTFQRFIAARKDSSLRKSGVLSSARCDHLRLMPPSTIRHWPVM